jgi:hypothetical protein
MLSYGLDTVSSVSLRVAEEEKEGEKEVTSIADRFVVGLY